MRQSEIIRKTAETDICLSLLLDGSGRSSVNTGVGFLDHMLTLFAKHGRFDLDVVCKGDIEVDDHHSVEDIGICLGQAFADALGEGRGIARYGDITLPMDEALILAAVDLGGRSHLEYGLEIPTEKVGTFDTELVGGIFHCLCAKCKAESASIAIQRKKFPSYYRRSLQGNGARLSKAVAVQKDYADEIPSTKGVL